jgi:hypothetical protein
MQWKGRISFVDWRSNEKKWKKPVNKPSQSNGQLKKLQKRTLKKSLKLEREYKTAHGSKTRSKNEPLKKR